LEDAVHKLDVDIAAASDPCTSQNTFAVYVNNLRQLETLREEKDRVEQRAQLVEQVLTLSAVNQSSTFTMTPQLITGMVNEAANLRKEMAEIVSTFTSYLLRVSNCFTGEVYIQSECLHGDRVSKM
jgi:hypothetical protein